MAIDMKTGVTVGREGEEIAVVFTRKGLKEHDAKVRADAIEELYDLTEKAIKHHADNFIQFGNGAGRRNGKIMGTWLFEYFLEMKIEAEKILKRLKEKQNEH